jgi:hypothetical protein
MEKKEFSEKIKFFFKTNKKDTKVLIIEKKKS